MNENFLCLEVCHFEWPRNLVLNDYLPSNLVLSGTVRIYEDCPPSRQNT
jgi:hypothetical protein